MKKILTSWWFTVVIGVAVFAGVIGVLWQPAPAAPEKEHTEESAEAAEGSHTPDAVEQLLAATNTTVYAKTITPLEATEVGSPGTLRFDAPEARDLYKENEKRKTALDAREKELNSLAERVKLELQTLNSMTSAVAQAIANFQKSQTNTLIISTKDDDKKFKTVSSTITNLTASTAVVVLDGMPLDEVVKIIQPMSDIQRAAILEEWANKTNSTIKASEVIRALLRISNKP